MRGHVALDGGVVGISDPEIVMVPNAAATLGMVFYELATNAAKYGALKGPNGRLDVAWQIAGADQARRVVLTWTETGGSPIAADATPGFGVNFVKRSVEYELQGKAHMKPSPGGLHWTVEFPMSHNVEPSPP